MYGYGLSKNMEEFTRVLNFVATLMTIGQRTITEKLVATRILEKKKEAGATPYQIKQDKIMMINTIINFCKKDGKMVSDILVIDKIFEFMEVLFKKYKKTSNLFDSDIIKQKTHEGYSIIDIQTQIPKSSDNTYGQRVTTIDITKRDELLTEISMIHHNTLRDILEHLEYDVILGLKIEHETLKELIDNRETLRRKWNDIEFDIKNIGNTKTVDVTRLRQILNPFRDFADRNQIDILIASLMLANPYGIKHQIIETNNTYMSAYNPHPTSFTSLPPLSIFADNILCGGYMCSVYENLEFGKMSFAVPITSKDMMILSHIYNPYVIRRRYSEQYMTSEKCKKHVDSYIAKQYKQINDKITQQLIKDMEKGPEKQKQKKQIDYTTLAVQEWTISLNMLNITCKHIKSDLMAIDTKNINLISTISPSYNEYRKVLGI